eukprot:TRINITY_DN5122_c2_g1_i1.p1 TRINITY_DN5122_c2_g1~~TRINITY_DN5122_c2_g1_i1.p1  ORF type:complete len:695 (-),score=293.77 TRINITY_DN5122_c2_g1_i1:15-2099(-)
MPALALFGKRLKIGSDDLIFPSCCGAFIKLIWCLSLGLLYAGLVFESECSETRLATTYLLGALITNLLGLLIDIILIIISLQGTTFEPKSRRCAGVFVYVNLALLFFEVIWHSLGTYWTFAIVDVQCPQDSGWSTLLNAFVISNWILLFLAICTICCTITLLGADEIHYINSSFDSDLANTFTENGCSQFVIPDHVYQERIPREEKMKNYNALWAKRCQLMCYCTKVSSEEPSIFQDVARVLAHFFEHIDVVPSDVAVGLALLRAKQKTIEESIDNPYGGELTKNARPISTEQDYDDLANLQFYSRYALAIYGWPIFIYMNPITGIFKLPFCENSNCCCFRARMNQQYTNLNDRTSTLKGDNICDCNYLALKTIANINDEDLIFASFENTILKSPYFICINKERKKIILSIRGTMSLDDCLTDVLADDEVLDISYLKNIVPEGESIFVHKGIWETAWNIISEINEKKIFEQIYSNPEFQSYSIVTVGHSLGAGTATVITLLLKQIYNRVLCYAYSPPGGLFSLTAAHFTRNFIISVAIGTDMIVRLSKPSLEALRDQMLHAIALSKLPKWCLISAFMCGAKEKSLIWTEEMAPKSESTMLLQAYEQQQQKDLEAGRVSAQLYPPGRILHIVRRNYSLHHLYCGAIKEYDVFIADNEDFNHIIVSPTMLKDHFPDRLVEILTQVSVLNQYQNSNQ